MDRHVHVAGAAGVGMSALAQALCWSHDRVTGSDRFMDQGLDLPIFSALRAGGIEWTRQDGSALTAQTKALVVSTAIEPENQEVLTAKQLGIPVRHRAQVLAELASGHAVLAVAGTAGKTTTTGMVGWTLEQLGADPTVVNGGPLVDWARAESVGNVRRGGATAPWVIEVDESDRSLLNFSPEWAIVTNISQDHFSLEEVQTLFREFCAQVQTGIVCGAGVAQWLGNPRAKIIEVTTLPVPTATGFSVDWRGLPLTVRQPGAHNALNALLAAELCAQLGFAPQKIAEALSRFGGIQRRLERVDSGQGGVRVVDDYGHNPAKLAAAWTAVCSPTNRVLGVWRPHGFGPLRSMLDPLTDAFASVCRDQDLLWLLPVYDAGGTADRTIHAGVLATKLRERGVTVEVAENYTQLSAAIAHEARQGDTILTMGARDPQLPVFAREIAAELSGK